MITVTTEDDPTPIVRVLATTIRRSCETPSHSRAVARMRGTLVFKSANDPQAATIRFSRGAVHLETGARTPAKVTITADLALMNEPDAPKPKVEGAEAHLLFALGASKALTPKYGTWQEEAARFWQHTSTGTGMPSGILVRCLDDGSELRLGGQTECEVHASAFELRNLFCGNTTLGERAFAGKLFAVGPLNHLAVLTGAGLHYSLGG